MGRMAQGGKGRVRTTWLRQARDSGRTQTFGAQAFLRRILR